jgi:uncharacterized protein YecE (DUF72 family)
LSLSAIGGESGPTESSLSEPRSSEPKPGAGRARIRVGTAGWDYPDWAGIVYPSDAGARFDRLAWVSRFVDVIEVNSTFYRPVRPAVAESWIRRTADREGFRFTAKAHRSLTHATDDDIGPGVAGTIAGLSPLCDAGRLGALLLQFPQSFHHEPRSIAHLDRLADRLEGWPLVAEVRHVGWGSDEARRWFETRAVGWCLVDQPRVGRSSLAPLPRVTGGPGYARLHGRNAANWFRPDAGRDARYDYLYSADELASLARSIERMAGHAEEVFVVQNNHFRGQALANALQMKHLLQGVAPEAPEELVAVYPQLASTVAVKRRRLF